MIFENVVDEDGEAIEFTDANSYRYKVYQELQSQLIDFNDYLFCEFHNDNYELPAVRFYPHDKKILIWGSGEKKLHQMTEIKSDFHHIFANYYWDEDKVTSIPLGYNYFFKRNYVPINERDYDVSFIGALNKNRISMVSELIGIHRYVIAYGLFINYEKTLRFLNNFLDWTKKDGKYFLTWEFNSGVDGDKYCDVLTHSKIVLAPKGWINTETFRLYEAMKYGCIVVCERLPNRSYYKDIPVIQVENWKDGFKEIKRLLKDEKLLGELSHKHKMFYEEKLSPKATAKIIMENL